MVTARAPRSGTNALPIQQVTTGHRLSHNLVDRWRLRDGSPMDIGRKVLGGGEAPVVVACRLAALQEGPVVDRQVLGGAIQALRQAS